MTDQIAAATVPEESCGVRRYEQRDLECSRPRLGVDVIAALLGFFVGFRMTRLPDPKPSETAEGMVLS